jgi:hypothetical protein
LLSLETLLEGHVLKNESARSVWVKVNKEMSVIIVLYVGKATVSAITTMAGTALNTTLKASDV